MTSTEAAVMEWRAAYRAELPVATVSRPAFAAGAATAREPGWKPLDQFWRPEGREPGFQPGSARVLWNERGLLFDIVFAGRGPRNAARSLNEHTWELGDIAEIFLQREGGEEYLEIHVTPENQRLQLRWTPAGFAAFRRDLGLLGRFAVSDPHWIESRSQVRNSDWSVSAFLPASIIDPGAGILGPATRLRVAVCRYDCTAGPGFVLSSTARLTQPAYHRREEWDLLVLDPR